MSERAGGGARGHRSAGFTLVEAVVAVGLLSLMLGVMLTLHDRMARHYILSEDRAAAQQNARLALSRLAEELRMAGLNVTPDGDASRGDESIEGMWRGAVTLRADLDMSDGAAAGDPELALGGAGATVSTGNDEIVTWVLAPAAGGASQSLAFAADVLSTPRDGGADAVRVDGIDLAQNDPPYTLYRIHLDAAGTGVVKQPVADQIRSLTFRYFDSAGAELLPAGGAEDPASRATRAAVARIVIELVGLTEHDDPSWSQPGESSTAVARRRRVSLRAEVLLPNRGLDGRADRDTEDPSSPAGMSALSPAGGMPGLSARRLDAAG